MSMKKIYSCNICREEIKAEDLNSAFGVHFSNNHDFILDVYQSTDGTHICSSCAKQLKEQLSKCTF